MQVVNSGAPSADIIARAKQGALSVLEKINQASLERTHDCRLQRSTHSKRPYADPAEQLCTNHTQLA